MKALDRSKMLAPAAPCDAPLLPWLAIHHPRLLRALLHAEGAICSLEQQGVTGGAQPDL